MFLKGLLSNVGTKEGPQQSSLLSVNEPIRDSQPRRVVFYHKIPQDYVVWPPREDLYWSLMRGSIPFVFVGRRCFGAFSGVLLVNTDPYDEGFWGKVEVLEEPGRVLASVIVGNVLKNKAFKEVDVTALVCFGLARDCVNWMHDAADTELLQVRPAVKKFRKVSCSTLQDVEVAVRLALEQSAPFAGSQSAWASFLEWYVGMSGVQDVLFVIKKPVLKPIPDFLE